MSFLSAIRLILENISGSMQAVHHWHSESLGSEADVPILVIWQVHAMNSHNLRECRNNVAIFLGSSRNNGIFAD